MKLVGIVLLIIGVLWAIVALKMDTTVETESSYIGGTYIPSQTVHNIGKMDERRNHLMLSGLLVVVGVVLFGFGTARSASSSSSPSKQILSDPPCERDLTIDAYKIWLVSRYAITRNDVLNKFECNGNLFESVDHAIKYAHSLEDQKYPQEFQNLDEQIKKSISFDGKDYWYAGFRYENLDDAVKVLKIKEPLHNIR